MGDMTDVETALHFFQQKVVLYLHRMDSPYGSGE